MDNEKSSIHSMNVSLGTPQAASARSVQANKPWILLICADLGFVSGRPEEVSSATLSEVIATTDITISGSVTEGLPEGVDPFFIEYPVNDLKDFSPAQVAEQLPYFRHLKRAATLLDALSGRKISADEALGECASLHLPQTILQRLGSIGTVPPAGKPSTAKQPPTSAKIDSILSLVDIGGAETESAPPPQPPSSDFIAAVAEGGPKEFNQAALRDCIKAVDELLAALSVTICNQPFFRAATSSWNGLKTVLKMAGRHREIRFFLHSAPYDAAERHFADALGVCSAEAGVPDMVLWDYPVTMDTATMEQLSSLGEHADRGKTVIVASLDYHEDLYNRICEHEPLKTVVEQPAYIPFRRLQETAQSRCITLCCPDARQQRSRDGQEIRVGSAWLLALQWVSSLIEYSAPFHLQNGSIQVLDSFLFPKLSGEVSSDAYRQGITLMRPNSTTTPRVLLADHESPYGSMLFNLLVNRTARLAAEWIGEHDKSTALENAAPELECFLRKELDPYHILSSDEAVAVDVSHGQSLVVTINSEAGVAGFPVRFQFSFNFRE